MEQSLEQIVAANLAELRRTKQWTQADLAEKINYSDKSVSKWERGEGLPDLKVLKQLTDLYGVSLDSLVTPGGAANEILQRKPKKSIAPRVIMELLAVSVVFLIATVVYVALSKHNPWICFVWAVPVAVGAITLFNIHWKFRVCAIVFGSLFVWTLLAAVYLHLLPHNLWMIFLVGVPTQAAIILGAQLRVKKSNRKDAANDEQQSLGE
ncbi:MAG: helix-turn-helix transcriptional regulator [Clostridia bacterium]|nr:helix-turn-helix transcriptional regulator [Clostridia bacterium]